MEYNPKYIYFEPVDGLIDKWCIAANSVVNIKNILEKDDKLIKEQLVQIKMVDNDKGFPFSTTSDNSYELCPFKFVYVDPVFQDMMSNEKELEWTGLKWTDLKIGDIIRSKNNRNILMQVQLIDKSDYTSKHIFAKDDWLSNDDLADWEKVED